MKRSSMGGWIENKENPLDSSKYKNVIKYWKSWPIEVMGESLEIFFKKEQRPFVLDGLCLHLPGGQILNHYQMYDSIIPEMDVITPEV